MYKKRTNYSRKLKAMGEAKERKRLADPAPDYPVELPSLRRQTIIIDYDFGKVVHRIDLYKTDRVDCYKAVADGISWNERIGWSRVLEGIRKSFARVGSV